MNEPNWLLQEVVVSVQKMLIAEHGGLAGVRDVELLDSALNRPKQQIAYGDGYGIPELAASYCFGLARNHCFADGNKRIALTAVGIFLEMNGYELSAPEADAVLIIEKLAAGEIEEINLAAWIADNSQKK